MFLETYYYLLNNSKLIIKYIEKLFGNIVEIFENIIFFFCRVI